MNKKYTVIKLDPNASLPQVHQLVQQLTWMIANGTIGEGETLPNIREMGDFLNIHMHTVRAAYHILEDRSMVSVKPRAGTVVQKYEPFITKNKSFQPGRSLIAVLLPKMNEFFDQIFQGIRSIMSNHQYLPIVIPCGDDPFIAESVYADVSARDFIGVINISLGFSEDFYKRFENNQYINVPLVFINDFLSPSHRILIDVSSTIKLATHHVIQNERENIALINCPAAWPFGIEVLKGFSAAVHEKGLKNQLDNIFTVPDFSHNAGVFCAEQIISGGNIPDAIIAVSDELAIGAISTFQKHGIRVPNDIAVIGYGNIPLADSIYPPLTTISLPLHDIGQQASTTLLNILQHKVKTWEHHEFSGKLIIRKSCGCKT